MEKVKKDLKKIAYWVLDVDGTMTDGSVYYDEKGNELKKFNTKDAAGFFAIHAQEMKIIVLTGRTCEATARRMKEMSVDYLFQNVKDKVTFIKGFMDKHGISADELAYIGDDLNDMEAMKLAGFRACPADACEEIREMAEYIAPVEGGKGVVRDVVKYVLKERGEWESAIQKAYNLGV